MDGNKDFQIENGVLTKYLGAGGDVTIPDGITKIGDRAFAECEGLYSIVIGGDVKSIGKDAFGDCKNLHSVVIGDGVESLENYAFFFCENLKRVVIGDGVTKIGDETFLFDDSIEEFRFSGRFSIMNAFTRSGFGDFFIYPFHVVFRNPESFHEKDLNKCLDAFPSHDEEDMRTYLEGLTLPELRFLEKHDLIAGEEVSLWISILQEYQNTECVSALIRYINENKLFIDLERDLFTEIEQDTVADADVSADTEQDAETDLELFDDLIY